MEVECETIRKVVKFERDTFFDDSSYVRLFEVVWEFIFIVVKLWYSKGY